MKTALRMLLALVVAVGCWGTSGEVAMAQQRAGALAGPGGMSWHNPAMQGGVRGSCRGAVGIPPFEHSIRDPGNFVGPTRSRRGVPQASDDWRSYGGTYTRPRGSGPAGNWYDDDSEYDAPGYVGRGYGRSRFRY